MENNVLMGQLNPSWKGNGESVKSITFCVTESCNLACKYCYMVGKNNTKKMSFETAKKAVDYILTNRDLFPEDSVVWDFIGGEPLLEINLIDRISDYIVQKMFVLNHPWFSSYMFSFSSNGLLYSAPAVQKYINKNKEHISIGLSVDGNKVKHDNSRIYPNGKGSYDDVVKNVPLWLEQFPGASTKATFSHDDLPYLKDSIINLWNIGIKIVAANVVFEDVWEDNDDIIFENQLKELADYIIDNKLWNKVSVRFFSPTIGLPLTDLEKEQNFCGAGKMLAVDCDGNFYPCIRFLDFSLTNRKGRKIGDVDSGINFDKVRPFKALNLYSQSPEKCINCDVASGCAWCTGSNYDFAQTNTIYERNTAICKMHKANVRANEYFWSKYEQATGLMSPLTKNKIEKSKSCINTKRMLFITNDNITPHCRYSNVRNTNNEMTKEIIKDSIDFCKRNGFIPVILGERSAKYPEFEGYMHFSKMNNKNKNDVFIIEKEVRDVNISGEICIFKLDHNHIDKLYNNICKLLNNFKRINVVIDDVERWENQDIKSFEKQLENTRKYLLSKILNNEEVEVNCLTDRLYLDSMNNCDCGEETLTIAPNGKIYYCPAFYFYDESQDIGNIYDGINEKNHQLLKLENSPLCIKCDAYQCDRCKFLNYKLTEEINVPSKNQCVINHIEREQSRQLQQDLIKYDRTENMNFIRKINYLDPIENIKK